MTALVFDTDALLAAWQQLDTLLDDVRGQIRANDWRRGLFESWIEHGGAPPERELWFEAGGRLAGMGWGEPLSLEEWRLRSWERFNLGGIAQGSLDAAYALEDVSRRTRSLVARAREANAGVVGDAIERAAVDLPDACWDAHQHLLTIGTHLNEGALEDAYRSSWAFFQAFQDVNRAENRYLRGAEELGMLLRRLQAQELELAAELAGGVFAAVVAFFADAIGSGEGRAGGSDTGVEAENATLTLISNILSASDFVKDSVKDARLSESLTRFLERLPYLDAALFAAGLLADLANGPKDAHSQIAIAIGDVIALEPHVALVVGGIALASLIDDVASASAGAMAQSDTRFARDWRGIARDLHQAGQNTDAGPVLKDIGAIVEDSAIARFDMTIDPQRVPATFAHGVGDLAQLTGDSAHLIAGVIQTVAGVAAFRELAETSAMDHAVNLLPAPSWLKAGIHDVGRVEADAVTSTANFVTFATGSVADEISGVTDKISGAADAFARHWPFG